MDVLTDLKDRIVAMTPAEQGLQLIALGEKLPHKTEAIKFYLDVVRDLLNLQEGKDASFLVDASIYKWKPVGPREFVTDPYYLGKGDEVYPAVLEEIVEINSGKYVEAVLTGGIGCISADTEFLSDTGWVRMDSWSGHKVAQYHASTGYVSFVVPEYVNIPAESFLKLKTKYGIDQLLSDEHKLLLREPKSGKLKTMRADAYAEKHNGSKKGYGAKFLTTFEVGGESVNPNLLRVQVMVCADATIRTASTGQCYLNLKKERKVKRARELLQAAGIEFVEFKKNKEGYTRFGFHAPWKTKKLSDFGWALGTASLQVIADECVNWDGHKTSYFTTLKEEADFMQYAGSASGYRTVADFDQRGIVPCWAVRLNPNTEITMQGVPVKSEITRVPSEDGRKYCFTVPTGFFIIRRGGRVVVTGNSGKTTTALYTEAYQLYLMSCLYSPHDVYDQAREAEILLIFQSITKQLAKGVDFMRFKSLITESGYFKDNFPYKKGLESELRFPNRIGVVPVSGSETAAIGQNVIGGIIDEMNYMQVVERSKQSVDGNVYDQAIAVYNSISRRRTSRFLSKGKTPGILCLVSSKRYPGQFTDIKEEEAKTNKTIYLFDKRMWEVKPEGTFCGEMFWVFTGDESRKPRIEENPSSVKDADRHLLMEVPIEFKEDFQKDIVNALREIAGVSTLARHPYMMNTEAVASCFGKRLSVFDVERCDFVETKVSIIPSRFKNPELPRWVHIDLGITGDSCGFACGYVSEFKSMMQLGYGGNPDEMMPIIEFDGVLEIAPPRNGEILFWKVRHIILKLRELGLNVKWVSFDSFQSRDSMQILRQQGFIVGEVSVDITSKPYDYAKSGFYSGRILLPQHKKAQKELVSLERNSKDGKIDHPPSGCARKDVKVACLGGFSKSFEELAADYEKGVEHIGWAWDGEKEVEVVLQHPRITKYVTELVEIEMDNGEIVVFTPDHLFMLSTGEYRAARDLLFGDTLKY